ncbi:PTS sugar transporter subunit IIA [Vibrio algarum]|uniref:PTS sugar transporter subunit IIA n=1 Tax=Vibrio algarum TaxID=3020714 RepID=A0ABT4YS97_9VIBR|nr:PTS sugar transporter subunit IIA [Vibrio sp. KJ40-1]MDB1124434.1 PTS sugar transporter subunit IIA [Vibrio sp. KJ40-1]
MNEYQITFFVNDTTGNAHVVLPLSRLAKTFKSTVRIVNITQNRSADLSMSVAVLQVGLLKGDLCQITAIGIDAELTCFVIKDIIAEHYALIGSHINEEFSTHLVRRLPQISPPCEIKWFYAKAQTDLNKLECLKGLAQLIHPQNSEELLHSLIKREEQSSTCVSPGIALPHVMFNDIELMSIAVIATDLPIDWSSTIGSVRLAIALILPKTPSKDQIVSATNLTRNLLNGQVTERLRQTRNSVDLQALLMYLSSRLLPYNLS